MSVKEQLSIGLISSGGDETEQLERLLEEHYVSVLIHISADSIEEQHIANETLHVWLLDIEDNDWSDALDDLLDQSSVPVFFNERGTLAAQSHPEFWIKKLVERLFDVAGIELLNDDDSKEDEEEKLSKESEDSQSTSENVDKNNSISLETDESLKRLDNVTDALSSTLFDRKEELSFDEEVASIATELEELTSLKEAENTENNDLQKVVSEDVSESGYLSSEGDISSNKENIVTNDIGEATTFREKETSDDDSSDNWFDDDISGNDQLVNDNSLSHELDFESELSEAHDLEDDQQINADSRELNADSSIGASPDEEGVVEEQVNRSTVGDKCLEDKTTDETQFLQNDMDFEEVSLELTSDPLLTDERNESVLNEESTAMDVLDIDSSNNVIKESLVVEDIQEELITAESRETDSDKIIGKDNPKENEEEALLETDAASQLNSKLLIDDEFDESLLLDSFEEAVREESTLTDTFGVQNVDEELTSVTEEHIELNEALELGGELELEEDQNDERLPVEPELAIDFDEPTQGQPFAEKSIDSIDTSSDEDQNDPFEELSFSFDLEPIFEDTSSDSKRGEKAKFRSDGVIIDDSVEQVNEVPTNDSDNTFNEESQSDLSLPEKSDLELETSLDISIESDKEASFELEIESELEEESLDLGSESDLEQELIKQELTYEKDVDLVQNIDVKREDEQNLEGENELTKQTLSFSLDDDIEEILESEEGIHDLSPSVDESEEDFWLGDELEKPKEGMERLLNKSDSETEFLPDEVSFLIDAEPADLSSLSIPEEVQQSEEPDTFSNELDFEQSIDDLLENTDERESIEQEQEDPVANERSQIDEPKNEVPTQDEVGSQQSSVRKSTSEELEDAFDAFLNNDIFDFDDEILSSGSEDDLSFFDEQKGASKHLDDVSLNKQSEVNPEVEELKQPISTSSDDHVDLLEDDAITNTDVLDGNEMDIHNDDELDSLFDTVKSSDRPSMNDEENIEAETDDDLKIGDLDENFDLFSLDDEIDGELDELLSEPLNAQLEQSFKEDTQAQSVAEDAVTDESLNLLSDNEAVDPLIRNDDSDEMISDSDTLTSEIEHSSNDHEELLIPMLDEAAMGLEFEDAEAFSSEEPLDENNQKEPQPPEHNLWVLGASLGGPAAVKRFLQALPRGLDATFILAQHIDENFLPVLSNILDTQTAFRSQIIESSATLVKSEIFIAPIQSQIQFDFDATVEPKQDKWTPPYSPCIDDVITEAARVYQKRCGVIIFSGMGDDGKIGAERARELGVTIWAQSPETSANSSMPDSVIDNSLVEFVGSPEELAEKLIETVGTPEAQSIQHERVGE